MPVTQQTEARLLLCGRPKAGSEALFEQWPGRLQQAFLTFTGSRSCEFWSPAPPEQEEWSGVLRFDSVDSLRRWRTSEHSRALMREAESLVEGGRMAELSGGATSEFYVQNSATEVIVTEVKDGMYDAFRDWANRIDEAESRFPGFRGSYVQPPQTGEKVWTTLLRFDTSEQLNAWLGSPERAKLLKESDALVDRVLAHHVDTSFPGWAPTDAATGKPPPSWKTASLVVLVLFPIVMLELKFLTPQLRGLNPAVATLIGNAISVGLVTWPLMPLAITAFQWWMYPEKRPRWVRFAGPLMVLLGFAAELAILWRLL